VIHEHLTAAKDRVGGNDGSQRDLDDVRRDELRHPHVDPAAVTFDARGERKAMTKKGQRGIGAALLNHPQPHIERNRCIDRRPSARLDMAARYCA
jgi:hypothetical protein